MEFWREFSLLLAFGTKRVSYFSAGEERAPIMHPQGEILLKAMAVASITFFAIKIGETGIPVLMAALTLN